MTTPPGVIPYIDVHDGPKRLVSVTIEPVSTGSACRQSLVVVGAAAALDMAAFTSTNASPSR